MAADGRLLQGRAGAQWTTQGDSGVHLRRGPWVHGSMTSDFFFPFLPFSPRASFRGNVIFNREKRKMVFIDRSLFRRSTERCQKLGPKIGAPCHSKGHQNVLIGHTPHVCSVGNTTRNTILQGAAENAEPFCGGFLGTPGLNISGDSFRIGR